MPLRTRVCHGFAATNIAAANSTAAKDEQRGFDEENADQPQDRAAYAAASLGGDLASGRAMLPLDRTWVPQAQPGVGGHRQRGDRSCLHRGNLSDVYLTLRLELKRRVIVFVSAK